jgi:hypothetical protein
MKKIILIAGLLTSHVIFAQNLISFNTKDLPKANGVDLTVQYPKGWTAQDGIRPLVIQNFIKEIPATDGTTLGAMSISIEANAKNQISYIENSNLGEIKKGMEKIGKVQKISMTKLEQENAALTDVFTVQERAGQKFGTKTRFLFLGFRDNLISLQCGIFTDTTASEEKINILFKKIEGDCMQFFNSLLLNQKYKKNS